MLSLHCHVLWHDHMTNTVLALTCATTGSHDKYCPCIAMCYDTITWQILSLHWHMLWHNHMTNNILALTYAVTGSHDKYCPCIDICCDTITWQILSLHWHMLWHNHMTNNILALTYAVTWSHDRYRPRPCAMTGSHDKYCPCIDICCDMITWQISSSSMCYDMITWQILSLHGRVLWQDHMTDIVPTLPCAMTWSHDRYCPCMAVCCDTITWQILSLHCHVLWHNHMTDIVLALWLLAGSYDAWRGACQEIHWMRILALLQKINDFVPCLLISVLWQTEKEICGNRAKCQRFNTNGTYFCTFIMGQLSINCFFE